MYKMSYQIDEEKYRNNLNEIKKISDAYENELLNVIKEEEEDNSNVVEVVKINNKYQNKLLEKLKDIAKDIATEYELIPDYIVEDLKHDIMDVLENADFLDIEYGNDLFEKMVGKVMEYVETNDEFKDFLRNSEEMMKDIEEKQEKENKIKELKRVSESLKLIDELRKLFVEVSEDLKKEEKQEKEKQEKEKQEKENKIYKLCMSISNKRSSFI